MSFQNEINLAEFMSPIDWAVFIFILLLTFLAVVFAQKRKKNIKSEEENFLDLMLMGRKLTLPLFVATLVATWYGGIFGVAQIAFESGIYNFITQGVFWYLSYFIFAFFIIAKIKPYHAALTMPDMVGRMFGPKSEKLAAIYNVINMIPISYAISIGILISLLTGFSITLSTIIGVLFVVLYSLYGGFKAVVYSDLVQFFVMCTSIFLAMAISVYSFGLDFLILKLPAQHFDPQGGHSLGETLSWGLLALATLVNPSFYQRILAAQNFRTAQKGILISTAIWIVFDLSLTITAMYAKAIIPNAPSQSAYLTYVMQLLPNGLKGYFMAGIAATILSTLDSYIFLAGSTLSYDLLPKQFHKKIWSHNLSIIVVGILAIVFSFYFEGNIKLVWKTLGALSASAMLGPFLLGLCFKNKFNDLDFLIGSCLGAMSSIVWRLGPYKENTGIDEIYIGTLISVLAMFTSSFRKRNII